MLDTKQDVLTGHGTKRQWRTRKPAQADIAYFVIGLRVVHGSAKYVDVFAYTKDGRLIISPAAV